MAERVTAFLEFPSLKFYSVGMSVEFQRDHGDDLVQRL